MTAPDLLTAAPSSEHDLSDAHKAILQRVRAAKAQAESGERRSFIDRCNTLYGLYRNYRKFSKQITAERDRDHAGYVLKKEWGADLFIPRSFSNVETVLPRIVSSDPRMRARPFSPEGKDAALAVDRLFARDQSRIGYETTLQAVVRDGLIYGLGVQKTYWQRKERKVKQNLPRRILPGYRMDETTQVVYEGPQADWIDHADFFWQPGSYSMATCDWAIHRTWRDYDYCAAKIARGEWLPVDLEALKRMGSDNYGESRQERAEAAGVRNYDSSSAGPKHEVWEYHTRSKVCTILDNQFVVQEEENPAYHGDLPFQIYRPIFLGGEFVGIGLIEPIQHLNFELNTLRGQRRDAATIALNPPGFYQEGMLADDEITLGPGVWNPVLGNPREMIYQVSIGDVPGSGYQEENVIKQDIENTTGVSDALAGGNAPGSEASDTATGQQLSLSNASVRISQMRKNFEKETLKEGARHWLSYYKQHRLEKEDIRVEDPEAPEGYSWATIGPEQLQAIEDVVPDSGSTEPDNPGERGQKAVLLYQALQADPEVDRRKAKIHLLRENDIPDPEGWLLPPPPPPIDPVELGKVLAEQGFPEELVTAALQRAMAVAQANSPQTQQPEPANSQANGGPPQEAPVG